MADREQAGTVVGSAAPPVRTGRADLHMHTALGDGLSSIPEILDYVEHETDLDVIAMTDHDDVRAGLIARKLAAQRGSRVEIIPGTEVTTRHGHVLALFVEQDFPMMQPLDRTIAAIHAAGGVAICPHPLSWLTTAISEAHLRRLQALGEDGRASGRYFDAIELLNPSIAGRVAYERAKELNRTVLHLPVMAGSDAHAAHLIGTAYTSFPGTHAADLRAALTAGTTRAHGRFWTLGETWSIAGESTYRAWFILPVRRLQRVLGVAHEAVPAPIAAAAPATTEREEVAAHG